MYKQIPDKKTRNSTNTDAYNNHKTNKTTKRGHAPGAAPDGPAEALRHPDITLYTYIYIYI